MDPPILGRHKEWEESETQKPRCDLELGTHVKRARVWRWVSTLSY